MFGEGSGPQIINPRQGNPSFESSWMDNDILKTSQK